MRSKSICNNLFEYFGNEAKVRNRSVAVLPLALHAFSVHDVLLVIVKLNKSYFIYGEYTIGTVNLLLLNWGRCVSNMSPACQSCLVRISH